MIWWHTRTHFLSTWWYCAVAARNLKDWFDPVPSITWLSQMDLNRVCCVFCSYAKRSLRGCPPLKSIFLYSSRCHSFTCPAHRPLFFFGNLRRQTQTVCARTGVFFNRQLVFMCFRFKLEYSTHTCTCLRICVLWWPAWIFYSCPKPIVHIKCYILITSRCYN